ncbi:hypothetical protein HZA42_04195 [Candidatus Peregrinibacteria bacterium]|nr:hypothetical protein [Candidatus Peregrinibacteria bacterium]
MKYIFAILTVILIAAMLSGCGKPTPPSSYVQEERAKIDGLNKKQGGVGINYNFQGPNRDLPDTTVTPLN